jgi:single-strand DNA-binding protein
MGNTNSVTLSGNLTRDPELRTLESGTAVAEFGIAMNKSRKVEDEWVNEAHFFEVAVYGNFGELVARKFQKGDFAVIAGELRQRRWETDEGEKRSKISITARQIDGPSLYKPASEDHTPVNGQADLGEPKAAAAVNEQRQPAGAGAPKDDIPF